MGIGYKAFLDRPLFGFGQENFSYPFEKFYDRDFYQSAVTSGTSSEHDIAFPHNKLIEIASSSGLFALLLYLLIFGYLAVTLYRRYQKSEDFENLIYLGLFSAYFINNLFLFDSITSIFYFFTFLALLSSIIYQENPEPFENSDRKLTKIILPIILIFFATGSIIFATISPAISAAYLKKSLESIVHQDYAISQNYFEKSIATFPAIKDDTSSREVAKLLSQALNASDNYTKVQQLYIINQIEFFEQRIQKDPKFLPDYSFLVQYYLYGSVVDKVYLEKAIDTSKEALNNGSRRPETYFLLADAYKLQGDINRALETGLEAIREIDSGQTYGYFANLLIRIKDEEQAVLYYEKAFERGYFVENDVLNYAKIQSKKENYQSMIPPYQNLVRLFPDKSEYAVSLTILYKYVGDKEKAREMALEIIRRFPKEAENAQTFINSL